MTHYKPYTHYKNSGVEWLGDIPDGWMVVPLRYLYRPVNLTGFDKEPLLSVYRDYGVVVKSSRDDNHNIESKNLIPYQLVEPGQLVTNKMKTWRGSIAVSELRGIVSPAYFVYKPIGNLFGRFIHYLMRCKKYVDIYVLISKGVRVGQWDLDRDCFNILPVLLPTNKEQKRIAKILDEKTAIIDELIHKTQLSIEKLKEYRSAFISSAVTGKIDVR